jgi:hypothetical protein
MVETRINSKREFIDNPNWDTGNVIRNRVDNENSNWRIFKLPSTFLQKSYNEYLELAYELQYFTNGILDNLVKFSS